MTRVVRIQNMEQAESHRTLIIAHWPLDGKPSQMTLDPQRELTLAVHDAAPMISIGKAPLSEDALPSDSIIETAKTAAQFEQQVMGLQAENQTLRADKDRLAEEVARLQTAAAEHKPAEDNELSARIVQLQSDNKVLAEAYEKRFDELKAAEADRDAYAARIDALTAELQALQPPAPAVNLEAPAPVDPQSVTKAQLLDEAAARGIEVDASATKADIAAVINSAEPAPSEPEA